MNEANKSTELQRLKVMAFVEGTTLAILVFIAVPLKHVAGVSMATTIVGPIHGMAFLLFFWMVVQATTAGSIPERMAYRMAAAAFIPFGGFVTALALHRKQAALLQPQ